MNKYGFIEDIPSEKDYVFGASLPMETLVEDGDWTPYLPKKELQTQNFETSACVSFSVLNAVEILIRAKYGEDVNYSDRFLAAVSGTKIGGNSPRKVCDSLRKGGVVEEDVWPFVDTFEKYYSPVPFRLLDLAKEFNDNWEFGYEDVPIDKIEEALKSSPLLVSVPAWHKIGDLYYRPTGIKDNHATTLIAITDNYKRVFDTYESNIKDIEKDMVHAVVKRFYVNKRTSKRTFWLWELIKRLIT